jgi:hypothetical protein
LLSVVANTSILTVSLRQGDLHVGKAIRLRIARVEDLWVAFELILWFWRRWRR